MTGDLEIIDNIQLQMGNGLDFRLYHDASNSVISSGTGDLYIQNTADDKDIIFKSDDGSGGITTYFYLDGSAGGALPFTVFPDNSNLTFGTGYDLRQYHNGIDSYLDNYEGNLTIRNYADDKDIIFQSDDGAGGVTTYFKLDGSSTDIQYFKDLVIADNVKAKFGNSSDLEIYHNGSNSYINHVGTGNLYMQSDGQIRLGSITGTEKYARFYQNAQVELFYDNVSVIETTATGIQVTDEVSIGTSLVHTGDTDTKVSFGTDEIVLTTAGADAVTVDSSGDVGIGTATPTQKTVIVGPDTSPDLSSATAANATLLLANSDPDYGTYFGTLGTGVGLIQQRRQTTATFYDLALQPYGGDVGIGETSVDARLHISSIGGSGISNIKLESGGSSKWAFGIPAGQTYLAFDETNDNLSTPTMVLTKTTKRVGIGTATPSAALEVSTANPRVKVTATTGTNPSYLNINNTGGSTYVGMESSVAGSEFTGTTAYASVFGSSGAKDTQFLTSSTVRMTIDSSGNVGIGTASPGTKLDVQSVPANVAGLRVSGNATVGQSYGATINAGTNASDYTFSLSSQPGVDYFRVRGDGNVGIGIAAPLFKLHTYRDDATATPSVTIEQDGTGDASIHFLLSGVVGWSAGLDNSDGDKFKIHNSQGFSGSFFTIDGSGDVGIGTDTPTATLQVVGLVEYADNAAALLAGLTAGAFYRTGDLLKVVH